MIRSYLPALVFVGLGAILGLIFVTANSLLGLELSHPHVIYTRASYFHSRAPLRQTNTNATAKSTTKTMVSTSANTPSTSS